MGSFGATGVSVGGICDKYHKSLIKVAEVFIHPEKIMCFNFITQWFFSCSLDKADMPQVFLLLGRVFIVYF